MDIINEIIGKSNRNNVKANKIINKDGITNSKIEICNELNSFLVNVGNTLEIEHINQDTLFSDNNTILKDSIFF